MIQVRGAPCYHSIALYKHKDTAVLLPLPLPLPRTSPCLTTAPILSEPLTPPPL